MSNASIDDCDEQLLEVFVSSASELLDEIEVDLLTLEQQGSDFDSDLVNKIFRAAHTIKGESGFVGLKNLGSLAHAIENLLDQVRDGVLPPTSGLINVLLDGFDELRNMCEDPDASHDMDVSGLKDRLDVYDTLKKTSSAAQPAPAPKAAAPVLQQPSEPEPVAKSAPEPAPAPAPEVKKEVQIQEPENYDPSLPNVLILDDDPLQTALLKKRMKELTTNLLFAHTPDEAYALMQKYGANVAICDYDLGLATAADVIPQLRSYNPLIQVAVLTGSVQQSTIIECFGAGANDFLNKQDAAQLVNAVDELTERINRWTYLFMNRKRFS